jgi:hypothetical protein
VLDDGLELSAPVTFLVGENGSGKPTLVGAVGRHREPDWADRQLRRRPGHRTRLADRVRTILCSTTNAVLATIRRDGSPRLSGADVHLHDGQLRIWSMSRSRKGQDLRRGPGVAVHGIPWD